MGGDSIMTPNNANLAMMSHLVKHPNNPDGIEIDKLNKMSDAEIIDAYNKWEEKKNVQSNR